jgi:citrate lyase subunit beta / citryl-CoA lyase
MARLLRSLFFVPGNNPRFIEKAKTLPADVICFDLEDSVPLNEKNSARDLIKKALTNRSEYKSEVYVRTNSPVSGLIPDDLLQIVQKGIDGIVIPKVNNVKEFKKIEKLLVAFEKKRRLNHIDLIPSIESAEGVVNTYDIASSSLRASFIVFGVFDLLNDLGIEYTKQADGAKYARAKIPLDAKAAGKYAMDAIWQDLNDKTGFEQDCILGKNLGYVGKCVIHPDQISTVHDIFYPTKDELEWAEKVCKVYVASAKKNRGATVVEGKMVDEVHFKRAKALLDSVKNI